VSFSGIYICFTLTHKVIIPKKYGCTFNFVIDK
jgi:hypothetical protein